MQYLIWRCALFDNCDMALFVLFFSFIYFFGGFMLSCELFICHSSSNERISEYLRNLDREILATVIVEICIRLKISYSGVRKLSYAIIFRTARTVSHTLLHVHGFRMRLNFVLSAESMKSTKLNRVRKFLR